MDHQTSQAESRCQGVAPLSSSEGGEDHGTCKKCEEKMPLSELKNHMENTCNYRVVDCDFRFAGCDFQGPKINMEMHIQDNISKHLKHISEVMKDLSRPQEDARHSQEAHVPRDKRTSIILLLFIFSVFLILLFVKSSNPEKCSMDEKDTNHTLSDIEHKLRNLSMNMESNVSHLSNLIKDIEHNLEQKLTVKDQDLNRTLKQQWQQMLFHMQKLSDEYNFLGIRINTINHKNLEKIVKDSNGQLNYLISVLNDFDHGLKSKLAMLHSGKNDLKVRSKSGSSGFRVQHTYLILMCISTVIIVL